MEVNLEIPAQPKEIELRQGQAAQIRQPKGYRLDTNIRGLLDYGMKRKPDGNNSHLIVDVESGKCTLCINEMIEEEKIVITGHMYPGKEYVDLGINKYVLYEPKELERKLRVMPHIFSSSEHYSEVMNQLRMFNAKVNNTIVDEDSRRGQQKNSKSSDIVHNLSETISLKLPVYVGEKPETWIVDVLVTEENGKAKFYLECSKMLLAAQEVKEGVLDKVYTTFSNTLPILEI